MDRSRSPGCSLRAAPADANSCGTRYNHAGTRTLTRKRFGQAGFGSATALEQHRPRRRLDLVYIPLPVYTYQMHNEECQDAEPPRPQCSHRRAPCATRRSGVSLPKARPRSQPEISSTSQPSCLGTHIDIQPLAVHQLLHHEVPLSGIRARGLTWTRSPSPPRCLHTTDSRTRGRGPSPETATPNASAQALTTPQYSAPPLEVAVAPCSLLHLRVNPPHHLNGVSAKSRSGSPAPGPTAAREHPQGRPRSKAAWNSKISHRYLFGQLQGRPTRGC